MAALSSSGIVRAEVLIWGKPGIEVRSVDLDGQGAALRDRRIPTFGPKLGICLCTSGR